MGSKCGKESLAVRSSLKTVGEEAYAWGAVNGWLLVQAPCTGRAAQASRGLFGQGGLAVKKPESRSLCLQPLAWICLHFTNSCKKLLSCCQLALLHTASRLPAITINLGQIQHGIQAEAMLVLPR